VRWIEKLLIGLFILMPFGFSALLPLSALPEGLSQSRKTAAEARVSNDVVAELNALESIVSYAPWQGANWQRLGRLRLDLGNNSGAVDAFNQALALGALSSEGMVWTADALSRNGETDKAKEILRELTVNEDVDSFSLLQGALIQRSLNDTNGALVNLLRAYEADPLNGEVNYRAGLQLAASRPDESLPFLERAAEASPERAYTCQNLIEVIRDSSNLGESGARYVSIGQELSTMSEWDVAQSAFLRAVELSPEDGDAWALLGEAVQQNGEDGTDYLVKARELGPDAELVNGLSGLYYRRQGKSELALVYLKKALDANPKALVWEIETGSTLDGMGDLEGALQHYQNATDIDPMQWLPWRALAAFCITRNYQLEEIGLPAARQASSLYKGSPALLDLLGTALMMTGDLDEALNSFLQADAIDPHQTAILIHIGQAYLEKEENETAAAYFRQAEEYAKDNRLREMAARLLVESGVDD